MTFGSGGASGARAHLAAVRSALATPLWLKGDRWQQLTTPAKTSVNAAPVHASVLRTAERTLRMLSRIPGSPWRATCLYRCVAATLVLRRAGVPARLRLGVVAGSPDVRAHSWVEGPAGELLYERRGEYLPLA